MYGDAWWDARIMRVTEGPDETFRYQVYYTADSSRQSGVDEQLIRPRQGGGIGGRKKPTGGKRNVAVPADAADPGSLALSLGFGADWKATSQGNKRWILVAPTGEKFKSKKAAMEFMLGSAASTGFATAAAATAVVETVPALETDPPWRTSGHEYLGRQVHRIAHHKVSSRRTVIVEQPGTVVGWIAEDDVNKKGRPGFISDKTGKPAKIFHVQYEVDKHTAHSDFQLTTQDLEEHELLDIILPPGEKYEPPRKDALYG